jgi:ketosteroid isomerase-like protein
MNGQMSDKSQMVNNFKTGQIKLTSDELSDMKVRVYGNTAVITGKADVKGTLGGKDATGQIMFTRVYVKKGGLWQSVAFQQTRVSNP